MTDEQGRLRAVLDALPATLFDSAEYCGCGGEVETMLGRVLGPEYAERFAAAWDALQLAAHARAKQDPALASVLDGRAFTLGSRVDVTHRLVDGKIVTEKDDGVKWP